MYPLDNLAFASPNYIRELLNIAQVTFNRAHARSGVDSSFVSMCVVYIGLSMFDLVIVCASVMSRNASL